MKPATKVAERIASLCDNIEVNKSFMGVTIEAKEREDLPQEFFGEEATGTELELWQYEDNKVLVLETDQNHEHYKLVMDRIEFLSGFETWYENEFE